MVGPGLLRVKERLVFLARMKNGSKIKLEAYLMVKEYWLKMNDQLVAEIHHNEDTNLLSTG